MGMGELNGGGAPLAIWSPTGDLTIEPVTPPKVEITSVSHKSEREILLTRYHFPRESRLVMANKDTGTIPILSTSLATLKEIHIIKSPDIQFW